MDTIKEQISGETYDWLQVAKGDLEAAKLCLDSDTITATQLSKKSAVNYFKSVLSHRNVEIPMIDSLLILAGSAGVEFTSELIRTAARLTMTMDLVADNVVSTTVCNQIYEDAKEIERSVMKYFNSISSVDGMDSFY